MVVRVAALHELVLPPPRAELIPTLKKLVMIKESKPAKATAPRPVLSEQRAARSSSGSSAVSADAGPAFQARDNSSACHPAGDARQYAMLSRRAQEMLQRMGAQQQQMQQLPLPPQAQQPAAHPLQPTRPTAQTVAQLTAPKGLAAYAARAIAPRPELAAKRTGSAGSARSGTGSSRSGENAPRAAYAYNYGVGPGAAGWAAAYRHQAPRFPQSGLGMLVPNLPSRLAHVQPMRTMVR